MKEIKELFEKITEEIEGAEEYAKEALRHKDMDHDRAEVYMEMSKQELKHVDNLHTMVVKLIKDYKARGGEIPKGMEDIYDWEHESMISWVAKVKMLQDMFR